ncbi:MAG: pyruvate synthase subunit beta [Actinobacteria bacterium]|jgi:pyruvate ferredoxin oxidoreductase beta subunit|nr:MAG: pyruvate synthase subunit beta [Actinomycetota bacterium]
MRLRDFPEDEVFLQGSAACQGCPGSAAIRVAFKALGRNTILAVIASCTSVFQSPFPLSALDVPTLNMAFATGGAVASGITAAADRLVARGDFEEKPTILAWAGDGGTYDIGIQALSGAAERNTDFIYVCYNNEAYSNTGTQRSGATPYAAWTTNTTKGKEEWRKDIAQIMIAHGVPYVATASLAYPTDMYRKFAKAKEIKGTRYIEIQAPCPPGWKFPSSHTIKVARLAVQSGMWMLFEHEGGKTTYSAGTQRIIQGQSKLVPVEDYLQAQGRFRHLFYPEKDEVRIAEIQGRISHIFETLQFTHKMKEHIMDIELAPPR